MSFHFVSHLWEVQDVENGTLIILTPRDVASTNVHVLDDELYEIVRENGKPNLSLDFGKVHDLNSMVVNKLIALDAKLHKIGGRLTLQNLDPQLYETFQAANATEILDINVNEYQDV